MRGGARRCEATVGCVAVVGGGKVILPDVGELVDSERLEKVGVSAAQDALLHEVDRLVRAHHDDLRTDTVGGPSAGHPRATRRR